MMNDEQAKLRGKECVLYARCSTKAQGDTSIPDQIAGMRTTVERLGMTEAAPPITRMQSASLGWNVDQVVEDLIDFKRAHPACEYLVIYDISRLTRRGGRDVLNIVTKLEEQGFTAIVDAEGTVYAGELGDMMAYMKGTAAKHQAASIGRGSARGGQSSLEEGRRAHCGVPPYGVDKRMLAPDGTPICILRHLRDGSQERYHPESMELLQRYAPNDKGSGGTNHYRKGKQDLVLLQPGSQEAQDVVISIFRWHDLEGLGAWRIAARLNDRGCLGPRGGQWSAGSVLGILQNSVFIGEGIANRQSQAVYGMRSSGQPKIIEAARSGKRPPTTHRPEEDWFKKVEEMMKQYLTEDVRDLARARIKRHLANQAAGRVPAPHERGGGTQSYLLTDILRSSPGDHAMVGHTGGRGHTYYKVRASKAGPGKVNRALRKMIPAEPVEQFVLEKLRAMLLDAPNLVEAYLCRLNAEAAALQAESARQSLQEEEARLTRQVSQLLALAERMDLEELSSKLCEIEKRREDVRAQMRLLADTAPLSPSDLRRLAEQMREKGGLLEGLPFHERRLLIEIFVSSATVDLATRTVEIELAVPHWWDVGQPPDSAYRNGRLTNITEPIYRSIETLELPRWCRRTLADGGACHRRRRGSPSVNLDAPDPHGSEESS